MPSWKQTHLVKSCQENTKHHSHGDQGQGKRAGVFHIFGWSFRTLCRFRLLGYGFCVRYFSGLFHVWTVQTLSGWLCGRHAGFVSMPVVKGSKSVNANLRDARWALNLLIHVDCFEGSSKNVPFILLANGRSPRFDRIHRSSARTKDIASFNLELIIKPQAEFYSDSMLLILLFRASAVIQEKKGRYPSIQLSSAEASTEARSNEPYTYLNR